jgi:cell division protein FtsZ
VFDETLEDQLRVTVVATGLGLAAAQATKPAMRVVETVGLRTGTDNLQVFDVASVPAAIDLSSVTVSGRGSPRNAQADAMAASGIDKYDIPAFLRRQSD